MIASQPPHPQAKAAWQRCLVSLQGLQRTAPVGDACTGGESSVKESDWTGPCGGCEAEQVPDLHLTSWAIYKAKKLERRSMPPLSISLGGHRFESKAAAKRVVRRILSEARVDEPLTDEVDRDIAKGCVLISEHAETIAAGWKAGGKFITVRPDPHSGDKNLVFRLNSSAWCRVGAMRAIAENKRRAEWTPRIHILYPERFQRQVRAMLLCRPQLPRDILLKIIAITAKDS